MGVILSYVKASHCILSYTASCSKPTCTEFLENLWLRVKICSWRINDKMQYGVMGRRLGWEPEILDRTLSSNHCLLHAHEKLFSIPRKGS